MCIFSYFDIVRIISLPSRKDRRRETKSEFKRNGYSIEEKNIGFFDAVRPEDKGEFPNVGSKGCFLSHLAVLKLADEKGAKNVLILEDDIAFSRDLVACASKAIEQLADLEWDILYFGHGKPASEIGDLWIPAAYPGPMTHFYAVNRCMLKSLITFLEEVQTRPAGHPGGGAMHYDAAINTFMLSNPDVKLFCFSKNLGYQRPSETNIHEQSRLHKSLILKPLWIIFRAFKRRRLTYKR